MRENSPLRHFMDKEKREKLEAKGWRVETVGEFLELTTKEIEFIELRLREADKNKKRQS